MPKPLFFVGLFLGVFLGLSLSVLHNSLVSRRPALPAFAALHTETLQGGEDTPALTISTPPRSSAEVEAESDDDVAPQLPVRAAIDIRSTDTTSVHSAGSTATGPSKPRPHPTTEGSWTCDSELTALQARYRKLRAEHRHVKELVQFRYQPLVNGTRLGHCEGLLDLLGKDSNGMPVPAQTCLGFGLSGLGSARRNCRFDPPRYTEWKRMPALCQYLTMGCRGSRHVFGFRDVQFSHADYLFLDFVFTAVPELQHATELGTRTGGTSLYLGMLARLRTGVVHTFDIKDTRAPAVQKAWLPDVEFFAEDILKHGATSSVIDSVSRENTAVLMDNGDKLKEVELYGQHLHRGNILLVHDWGDEVFQSEIDGLLDGYEPVFEEFAEHLQTSLRAWRRIK